MEVGRKSTTKRILKWNVVLYSSSSVGVIYEYTVMIHNVRYYRFTCFRNYIL
jgi:hypothetical protein